MHLLWLHRPAMYIFQLPLAAPSATLRTLARWSRWSRHVACVDWGDWPDWWRGPIIRHTGADGASNVHPCPAGSLLVVDRVASVDDIRHCQSATLAPGCNMVDQWPVGYKGRSAKTQGTCSVLVLSSAPPVHPVHPVHHVQAACPPAQRE